MDSCELLKLKDHLQGQEESLLLSATRSNTALVASMLADGFREFGTSGRVYSKTDVIGLLADEASVNLSAAGFELTLVSEDAALLTYDSKKQTAQGLVAAHRSSLWIRRQDTWRMLFHQGTNFEP